MHSVLTDLTSEGMCRTEALEYISQNAGTFFDPNLAELFLEVIDELESEVTVMGASDSAGESVVESSEAARPSGSTGKLQSRIENE